MTLRELRTCVATDNHATFTLTEFGYWFPLENDHWDEIGNRYKSSEVWMAYPEESSCCSVKKWGVALKCQLLIYGTPLKTGRLLHLLRFMLLAQVESMNIAITNSLLKILAIQGTYVQ